MISSIKKFCYYLAWGVEYKLGGKRVPLSGSIIITDKCNLHCRHCSVSRLGYMDLSFDDVKQDITTLYNNGIRMLVITGGEPFMWFDGDKTIEGVVRFARDLGFFRIVICTNGTFALDSSADYLWVSLDGLADDHSRVRGNIYDKVVNNIAESRHKNININYTVSKLNIEHLELSAEEILKQKNIKGILFHLYTPYLGNDHSIKLSKEEKKQALNDIIKLKRKHPKKFQIRLTD